VDVFDQRQVLLQGDLQGVGVGVRAGLDVDVQAAEAGKDGDFAVQGHGDGGGVLDDFGGDQGGGLAGGADLLEQVAVHLVLE
jgi:hypothetical protein